MKKVSALLNQAGVINPLLILLAIAGVVIFILIAQTAPFQGKEQTLYPKPPAEAAGKGKGKPSVTKGNLSVSPDTLYAGGTQYTITRSRFFPNQMVAFSVADPGCCIAFNLWADASGNVSFNRSTGDVGTYKINASQLDRNKYILMATISFSVIAP